MHTDRILENLRNLITARERFLDEFKNTQTSADPVWTAVRTTGSIMLGQALADLRMIAQQLEESGTTSNMPAGHDRAGIDFTLPEVSVHGSNTSSGGWDCDHQNMGKGSGEIDRMFGI